MAENTIAVLEYVTGFRGIVVSGVVLVFQTYAASVRLELKRKL